jgi:hypothetical protein
MVSQLPSVSYIPFPHYSSLLLKAFAMISFSSIRIIPFDCSPLLKELNINYHQIMILTTLIPLIFYFCLFLLLCTLNEISYIDNPLEEDFSDEESDQGLGIVERKGVQSTSKERKQFSYLFKVVTIVYFFYDLWIGNIAQHIFGSFYCVQLNNNPHFSNQDYYVLW